VKIRFKDLPVKEQEGYVLNHTLSSKVKVYLLSYLDVDKALAKLDADDPDFFTIDTEITLYDGYEPFNEQIKATKKEVVPIVARLIKENRYFGADEDYQTMSEAAEKETHFFQFLPEDFITDALVDHMIEKNKHVHVTDIPKKHMTAERFKKLAKKDSYTSCRIHDFAHLLTDEDIVELLCSERGTRFVLDIPKDRWTKEMLHEYLVHCLKHNIEPGFIDFRVPVPKDLMDSTYYKCCCMLGGFYYSRIPAEMRETVISEDLIAETICRWDIYHENNANSHYWNGLGWMLQYLPEKFVNKDLCVEICSRYPYAISHVPDEIIKDENFWKETLANGNLTPLEYLDVKRVRLLPKNCQIIREDSNRKEALKKGEVKGKDACEWKNVLASNGARIHDLPKNLISVELLLIAMRSNAYAFEKDLSILDSLNDSEKKEFWESVVSERLFNSPISVPDEHMTEDIVLEWAEKPYSYDVNKVSKAFRTESVLMMIAKKHPDRFSFPLEDQTQELIDTLIGLQEKDYNKALILQKSRYDLQRKELVDELCVTAPTEVLRLSSVTKEQIDRVVSLYPHLILRTPFWYIMDLRKGTGDGEPEASEIVPLPVATPILKVEEAEPWQQMSIFDYIVA